MATNDALFSVTGYVATQPKKGLTKSGTKTLTFRIGWTPREVSRQTGEWADLPSSFASVTCFKKIAENAAFSLRKGDPIVLKGTVRIREYADDNGNRRNAVDVVADFLGHDLAKGTSNFTKQSHRGQQTAEEYELSQSVAANRLPGDVAAAHEHDVREPEAIEPDELVAAGGAESPQDDPDALPDDPGALPDDPDDLELAAAVAGPDRDNAEDTDNAAADADNSDADNTDADRDVPAELGEVGGLETPSRRSRSRKAEPVGAGV